MPCGSGVCNKPEVTLPAFSAPLPSAPSSLLGATAVSSSTLPTCLYIPSLSGPQSLRPSACTHVQRPLASPCTPSE